MISYTVKFPPNSIQLLISEKSAQCGRAPHKGKLFNCTDCHAIRLINLLSRYVLKLEFTKEIRKSVTRYY